jgi:hypothetical protein
MPDLKIISLNHDRWLNSLIMFSASICLALLTSSVDAAGRLPAFTATYGIEKYGVKLAQASYTLTHTEDGYRFSQETQLSGMASLFSDDSISAVSVIEAGENGMLLKQHRYIQTGKEKNRDEDFSIEWNRDAQELSGRITGVVRNQPVDLEVDKPVWDMLSFQIPLMQEASEDRKRYPYYALLKGELDTYFFDLVATEEIAFAGRKYRALKLVRVNPEKKRELRIWLLPELNNIPAVVENMRDGKQHSYMKIESVSFEGHATIADKSGDSLDNGNDEY